MEDTEAKVTFLIWAKLSFPWVFSQVWIRSAAQKLLNISEKQLFLAAGMCLGLWGLKAQNI